MGALADLWRRLAEALAEAEGRKLERLHGEGTRRVLLWTQPSMDAAPRLYEATGVQRVPAPGFTRGARTFRVYEPRLQGQTEVGMRPRGSRRGPR